ncbi:hypothetical protein GCM10027605_48480 [Micromonospora zhanjiangensis]
MRHVELVSGDRPVWLPENFRRQAQGEFTWLCPRCNSYPAMKWSKDHGAWAGLCIHLGKAHDAGRLRGVAAGMAGSRFEMIPLTHPR